MSKVYLKSDDTIAAVATGMVKSAISIVRLSGPNVLSIAAKSFRGAILENRVMTYGYIYDGDKMLDEVMVCYIGAPNTFTGEDVVEIYCHGSLYVTKSVLAVMIKNGARLAEPGEFTKRAFLNGKIDLSQAEAVADVINANTLSASDVALNQLSGRLKNKVNHIMGDLTKQIARIEVTVDYPTEDIEEATNNESIELIDRCLEYINSALDTAERGKIFRGGIRCAIVGQPNVGKSSLLNAFLGESRAIVTDVAGTTRDTLEAHVDMMGVEVMLIDTAGIHETEDVVEKIGVERAMDSIRNAHVVLFVLDMSALPNENDIKLYDAVCDKEHIVVLNKSDVQIDDYINKADKHFDLSNTMTISTADGTGIKELEDKIVSMVTNDAMPSQMELSNVRHIDAITKARESLIKAKDTLFSGMPVDLSVVDLRDALDYLGEITGVNVDEGVINSIFSDFCLGK